MERNWNETMQFDGLSKDLDNEAKRIFLTVYDALQEKGYNPVNQIVGYILSGDPTYISPAIITPEASFAVWNGMNCWKNW